MRYESLFSTAIACFTFGLPCSSSADVSADCRNATAVSRADEYRVQASTLVRKQLRPHFFGFNVVWVGFQEDWVSPDTGQVSPDVVEAMSFFPGAVYRYPGGTVSNYFDWRSSVGTVAERPKQKAVDWKNPEAVRFGFHEFLHFVRSVKGSPWLVANLYGAYDRETPLDKLKDSAHAWAASARKINAGILRWELGNELDRDRFLWSPEKYASRATAIAKAIRQADPDANFVSMLEDYDAHKWITARNYNTQIATSLATTTNEFALHLYYDGKPGGPPIPHRYRHVCESAAAAGLGSRGPVKLWITEHARWPPGFGTAHWKQNWPKTQDLSGALAVADMVIAASQSQEIEGLFLHSLSGSQGPWPLLHRSNEGFKPSLVYWSLRVMRDSMLDMVLQTATYSKNNSGYVGGYDLRASLLTNSNQTRFTLWAVNRSPQASDTNLKIPQLSGKSINATMNYLQQSDLSVSNDNSLKQTLPISKTVLLTFDKHGDAAISLPAYSVSALLVNH